MTETYSFTATDPENSNILECRFFGLNPYTWITMTQSGLFSASPNLQQNDYVTVYIEAFDGALASLVPTTVNVNVIYDPPVPVDHLVDQKVKVGKTLNYWAPAKNIIRQHDAVVTSPGLIYFG